jgi:acyl-coenzyme A synthetase/AMP-(fatty) acid ligase
VRQTARGVQVLALADSGVDTTTLASDLREALSRVGLRDPVVEIEIVPALPHTVTGKVTRFIPLKE